MEFEISKISINLFKELEIDLKLFDKSIEFHNDKDLLSLIESLTQFEQEVTTEFSKDTIIKML